MHPKRWPWRKILAVIAAVVIATGILLLPITRSVFVEQYLARASGILAGCLACYSLGGPLADWLCMRWQQYILGQAETALPGPPYPAGGKMGRLERNLFVLAVFFPGLSLITAVIILKTFFLWWEKQSDIKELKQFHWYVGGNLISLLTGLLFGSFGQYVSLVIEKLC